MKLAALSVIVAVLALSSCVWRGLEAQPPLWNGLESGSYRVGFRTTWEMDASRPFTGGDAKRSTHRPLRIDVWYPTLDRGSAQKFEAYLDRDRVPHDAARAHAVVLAYDRWSYGQLSESGEPPQSLISSETAALQDAVPAPGPFPLVVYVGGWYARSSDNTVFAEILASRGFVVVTTPQLDRGLWEYDFSLDAETLETRVSDVEIVLGIASRLPSVDATRVAVGGFSGGGIAALVVAGRAGQVDAVFGLDPSYMYEGRDVLIDSTLLEPEDVRVPVLSLHSGHPDWTTRANLELLERLTSADLWTVAIPNATHGDFSDDVAIEAALGLVSNPVRPTTQGWAAYESWFTLLTEFLEQTLKTESDLWRPEALERKAEVLGLELRHAAPVH